MKPSLALALVLSACTSPRTEVLVEVSSDLGVPGELDRIEITATDPAGTTRSSSAVLGGGELPLPRVLGLSHEGGALGPFTLTVRGELDGAVVVSREASFSFQSGRTLVLSIELLRECIGESCAAGLSCARGGCRSIEIQASELTAWDGQPPPRDAGPYDACSAAEQCNGSDDDCDGMVDEGFDLETDRLHCGSCTVSCADPHTTSSCVAGACEITACEAPFDDCDGDADNGCETDTSTSANDCGTCGTVCANPDRVCCSGTCARGC
jgi:hypothetical protein